jgi:hypothetical protein
VNQKPESPKYKVYKISIHLFLFSYVADSKIYTIKPTQSAVLRGLTYSLVTLFLGWWDFSLFTRFTAIKSSLTALHINFSGGEDYTIIASQSGFDERTKWIYNNLSGDVASKLSIETLDIIVELLDDYPENSLVGRMMYLNESLRKVNVINLFNNDLQHIAIKYEHFKTRSS